MLIDHLLPTYLLFSLLDLWLLLVHSFGSCLAYFSRQDRLGLRMEIMAISETINREY
jgi:hypothetical protein